MTEYNFDMLTFKLAKKHFFDDKRLNLTDLNST